MYVNLDGAWMWVWKIEFSRDGRTAQLWVDTTLYVKVAGKEAADLRRRLEEQDPAPNPWGRMVLVAEGTEPETGEEAKDGGKVKDAVAGRAGNRRGRVRGS